MFIKLERRVRDKVQHKILTTTVLLTAISVSLSFAQQLPPPNTPQNAPPEIAFPPSSDGPPPAPPFTQFNQQPTGGRANLKNNPSAGWRNPTGFKPGEQPPGLGQPAGRINATNRRSRMTQSINDLIDVINEEELSHVPALRIPLTNLTALHKQRMQLLSQRDSISRQTTSTAVERTDKFHALMQQEEAINLRQQEVVRQMIDHSDQLTSEIIQRREALRKELRDLRSRPNQNNDNDSRQKVRRLNTIIKFYEWLEEALPDLDPAGPNPLHAMVIQSWEPGGGWRSGNEMNTTAVRALMPQLRELRNRQEQLMRDANDLDQRISEIEDLLNIQQQRLPQERKTP